MGRDKAKEELQELAGASRITVFKWDKHPGEVDLERRAACGEQESRYRKKRVRGKEDVWQQCVEGT